MSKQTHLLIDGQNFINRVRTILVRFGIKDPDITKYDYWGLFNEIFKDTRVDMASFYAAQVRADPEDFEKSKGVLERSEALKNHLEKQGFRYVTSGIVRKRVSRDREITYQEKGVDVRIAVDMLTAVYENQADTLILVSSDSDLQSAIKTVRKVGAKVIYVGFSFRRNLGLETSTDKTMLLTNDTIRRFTHNFEEKIVAIDIALLLPFKPSKLAIDLANSLPTNRSYTLNRIDRLPHLSLGMAYVPERRLKDLSIELESIAKRIIPFRLQSRDLVETNSRGTSALIIGKTNRLKRIQSAILEVLKKYRVPMPKDAAKCFIHNPSEEIVSDFSIRLVDEYPNREIDKLTPHITIGNGIPSMKLFKPFFFYSDRLALCRLGTHCTCRKVINYWRLESKTNYLKS